MYGLIGKMRAARGQRDAVMDVLRASTGALPGCLSYIVATDPADADAIWVTEVWTDQASHKASLQLIAQKGFVTRGVTRWVTRSVSGGNDVIDFHAFFNSKRFLWHFRIV